VTAAGVAAIGTRSYGHKSPGQASLAGSSPIVGATTPTAGGVVFFGDLGGNFYALDSSNGQKLWGQVLGVGGGIGGGAITYSVDGAQRIAVAHGFTMVAWPTKPGTARSLS
jgi:alcohol dehydrogenase (cytochrome c)